MATFTGRSFPSRLTAKKEILMVIYVQDMIGNPLMPTTRAGWVRRSLKSGKAEVMSLIPFTVRLTL